MSPQTLGDLLFWVPVIATVIGLIRFGVKLWTQP